MTYLPHPPAYWRSPRVRFADIIPVALRMADGRRHRGKLETISLTGGLLTMASMLDHGSRIKLMFLTPMGPVLGLAEMLSPVSPALQPFRFVAIEEGDQRRLRSVIQSFLNPGEQAWIEKYRAALVHQRPARRGIFRVAFGSFTILTLLGTAIYLLNARFLK